MPSADLACVAGVEPVEGWALFRGECWFGDRRPEPFFYAVRGDEQRLLNLSSYFFTPSQARFAWLVRHGFPHGVLGDCGARGPLCDATIDAGIAAEAATARLEEIRARLARSERVVRAAVAIGFLVGFGLAGFDIARGLGAAL